MLQSQTLTATRRCRQALGFLYLPAMSSQAQSTRGRVNFFLKKKLVPHAYTSYCPTASAPAHLLLTTKVNAVYDIASNEALSY